VANAIFERANEGIFVTDANGRIEWTNRAFEEITGYTEAEAQGRSAGFMRSGKHRDSFYGAMWKSLGHEGRWSGEIYNRRRNGEIYPCLLNISAIEARDGTPVRYVALLSDITELKSKQAELRRLAYFDGLTGLPNRKLLQDRLGQAMAQVRRQGGELALLFLDVDDFKQINDRCGHSAGDDYLRGLGASLADVLRGGDTVARLGGDEFVVLLVERESDCDFIPVVERLRLAASISVPVSCCEPVQATASFGIAIFNQHSPPLTPDQLLRRADNAMYQAKLTGGDRYHFFDPRQDAETVTRLASLQEVDRAIKAGELRVRYQPVISLRSDTVVGVEALVRWEHPDRGLMEPADFLPHIADSDVEISLGTWMLHEASALQRRLAREGHAIYVSVNIAASHLYAAQFVEDLASFLPPQRPGEEPALQLEILETTALQDLESARERIEACRQLGVAIALDDFGTGFSSLTYLRELPADTVKLDRSFVSRIDVSDEDNSIVETTIRLAHALGKKVTAEGVESASQLEMLAAGDCDAAQGFLIAEPLSEAALLAWLSEADRSETPAAPI
jgi:diguanylate cyclase (GGDEF)-like protein/PAS domain S-box-containing protein